MKKISEPIVFFGSGAVAAKSLELLSEWVQVEAVVTKPQPTHHKDPFPVLVVAQKLELKMYTPDSKAALSELIATKPFKSRLGVVVDYGFIINEDVINYFPLGIINSHFSLLPQWRGADPITFSILSGQKKTGVSIMLINAGMDEGPLLGLGEQPLDLTETTPELTRKLILLSDALLQHEIPKHMAGESNGIDQSALGGLLPEYPDKPTYSRKLTKADGRLDFNKPAEQLEREVRAYYGWPGSRTSLAHTDVIITHAHVLPGIGKPGVVWREGKKLGIYTSNGIFVIDSLKPAGKTEMTAAAFLNGYGQNL